jgi:hypothetical protein
VYSQDSAQSGTPDYLVVHRTVSGAPGWISVNRPLLGEVWRRTTIIHRTIRWCTGLSGEPTVDFVNGRQRNQRAMRGLSQRSVGAPDCPVCTGLSGVHRTVSGEPRRPLLQLSAVSNLEGDHASDKLQDLSDDAPDSPVRHPTESKYCLPKWIPTAPRPLGSIKGTPRRLQQVHKSSQQL